MSDEEAITVVDPSSPRGREILAEPMHPTTQGDPPSDQERRVVWRLTIRKKILRYRRGNYSRRRLVPFMEWGPFGCWLASWSWGQLSWELKRWA